MIFGYGKRQGGVGRCLQALGWSSTYCPQS